MAPLFLLSIIPMAIGFWMGWRSSRRWPMLLMQAVIASLMVLIFFLAVFTDRPQELSARYIWTAAQYWVIPYFVFLLIPCVVAEAIGKGIRNRVSTKME